MQNECKCEIVIQMRDVAVSRDHEAKDQGTEIGTGTGTGNEEAQQTGQQGAE